MDEDQYYYNTDYIDSITKAKVVIVPKKGFSYTRLKRSAEKPQKSVSKVDTGRVKQHILEF
jgi:hypothetical protein